MVAALATLVLSAPASFYDFTLPDIDGKEVALKQYAGKVVLVVNVASQCGLTPQYAGLERLYAEHKADGLVVLGFPANDFRGQEPGTNAQIKAFCTETYHVTFPILSKITVVGDKRHPLYTWLVESGPRKDPIEWNFAKFLIDKKGRVANRFAPKVSPESDAVHLAIQGLLKE